MKLTTTSGFEEYYKNLNISGRSLMRMHFIKKWDLRDQYHFRRKMKGKSKLSDEELEYLKKYINANR